MAWVARNYPAYIYKRWWKPRGLVLWDYLQIVILGVLAAVALPKFVDLRADAQLAATQAMAGATTAAYGVQF